MKILKIAASLIVVSFVCLISFSFAETLKSVEKKAEAAGKNEMIIKSADKSIQGEVSGINKRNITVIYNRNEAAGTEEEMMVSINKGTQLMHKRNYSEIKEGDLVNVEYEEQVVQLDDGKQETRLVAKAIKFVKQGKALERPVGAGQGATSAQ